MEIQDEWYKTKYEDNFGTFYINKFGKLQKRFKSDKSPKLIEGNIGSNGYLYVSLTINGKHVKRTIHSIMAEVFLENTHKHRNIDHINRDKTDNRLENLRYFSQSYNMLNRNDISNIFFDEKKGKWLCKISNKLIGSFYTKEEAFACKFGYLKALDITIDYDVSPQNPV